MSIVSRAGSKGMLAYIVTLLIIIGMLSAGFGHVVNVSSIAGKVSTFCRTSYCAAKFGLNGMMDALRHEVEHTLYILYVYILYMCVSTFLNPSCVL